MENSASAIVNCMQQHSKAQKSKKKSKNKKQNTKNEIIISEKTMHDGMPTPPETTKTCGNQMIAVNGLSEQLQQQLHINDHHNYHKVNGIIVENNCTAAHNGHHHVPAIINDNTEAICTSNGNYSFTVDVSPADEENEITITKGKKSRNTRHCHKKASNIVAQKDISPPLKTAINQLENGFNHVDVEEELEALMLDEQPTCSKYVEQTTQNFANISNASNKTMGEHSHVVAKHLQTVDNISTNESTTTATTTTTINSATSLNTANDNIAAISATDTATTATATEEVSEDETCATPTPSVLNLTSVQIEYKEYESELQMHDIMRLIQAELSEPYSIYTYRYFIYNWPKLCFLAAHNNEYVGAIVCKLDMHMNSRRGYIAMLAVRKEYRKLRIGTTLVQKAIEAMLADDADEVVLETEMRNLPALRLYENLGFVRDKRLFRYYLNGVDALRLKLWFR